MVDSSHFVDRDRVANGHGAVCDCEKLLYKSLKNERSAVAYYSNHGKYSFGSAIFEYSRIFEQFVSTLKIELRTVSRHANVCCEDDFFSGIADFETTPRAHVDGLNRSPGRGPACVACVCNIDIEHCVCAARLAM